MQLTPIPGSPYASDADASISHSLSSKHSSTAILNDTNRNLSIPKEQDLSAKSEQAPNTHSPPESISRARPSYTSHRLQPPQSLDAALEILTSQSDRGHTQKSITEDWTSTNQDHSSLDENSVTPSRSKNIPPSPSRPVPDTPVDQPTVGGKVISGPVLNRGMHLITHSLPHGLMSLCSRNLTNEPREKSRYRKTTIGRTYHSSQYARCIHNHSWIQVGLFQFIYTIIGLTILVVALIRYYHMHLLQTFNIFQNPNMPNNTFLRIGQDSSLEGEYRWRNS